MQLAQSPAVLGTILTSPPPPQFFITHRIKSLRPSLTLQFFIRIAPFPISTPGFYHAWATLRSRFRYRCTTGLPRFQSRHIRLASRRLASLEAFGKAVEALWWLSIGCLLALCWLSMEVAEPWSGLDGPGG